MNLTKCIMTVCAMASAAVPLRAQSAPDFDRGVGFPELRQIKAEAQDVAAVTLAPAAAAIAAGDTVINKGREVGIVLRLMPNGDAEVLFENNLGVVSRTSQAQLWRSVSCSGPICVGQKVTTSGAGKSGTVVLLFSNGEAKVLYDGDRSKLRARVEKLSPVEDAKYDSQPCLGSICVGQWVRNTKAGRIGVVASIDSKGQARLMSLDQWECQEAKVSELAPAVASIDGVSAGQKVNRQNGGTGTVALVFADGAALVGSDSDDVNEYPRWSISVLATAR